jgi:hypothetical protein
MIASTFFTVIYVTVASASCDDLAGPTFAGECQKSGGDQHSIAFVLFGLVVIGMVALGLSRNAPGPWAVVLVIGIAAVAISLGVDLPQASKTGAIGINYRMARAHAGNGLWLELAAGVVAIVVGAVGMRLNRLRTPAATG